MRVKTGIIRRKRHKRVLKAAKGFRGASGELMSHLLSIQEEAEQMRENILPSMKKEWGLTEQLKIDDQMEWVGLMNNLEATIKEIILKELVYV